MALLEFLQQQPDTVENRDMEEIMAVDANARKAVTINAKHVQVLSPPIPWNWNESSTGQVQMSQIVFCDAMPQNITDDYFSLSSKSFSDGYSSFLDMIDEPSFPIKSLLQQTN